MTSTVSLDRQLPADASLSPESREFYGYVLKALRPAGLHSYSASIPESTSVPDENVLLRRFQSLVDTLSKECALLSSTHEVAEHSAYVEILGMGGPVLPLILRELEKRPRHYWFWALREISQENPVPPEHRGMIREMANDWLDWARGKGLMWSGSRIVFPHLEEQAMRSRAKRMIVTTVSHGLPATRHVGGGLIFTTSTIGPKEYLDIDPLEHFPELSCP